MAGAKHKKHKVKKRCCDSTKRCRGCPLRPANAKRRKRS